MKNRMYDAWTHAVSSCLALISPRSACRYKQARDSYRSYAAASSSGPNSGWRPHNRTADAELKRDFKRIMARCRDLAMNSPYIRGAIKKIGNNVVRNGIYPQWMLTLDDGQTPDTRLNDYLEKEFRRWAKKSDISGHDSYGAQQVIGLRHCWHDGEFLIHRVWDAGNPALIPLRLELLECDLLDDTVDGKLQNGNVARRGIELSASTGKPEAYWLYNSHPGDYQYARSTASRRIPAQDIIHVFERERISQTRGVPWFVAIVMEMYDLGEYQSFERIGAKLAAAFGIFVKSQFPEVMSAPNIFGQKPGAPNNDEALPEYIEPGRIQRLPFGTEIQVASHNRPGDNYAPYIQASLKGASTGAGMTYEAFSNDYTSASYSSARAGALEERLSYQGQQMFLNEKMNNAVVAWFLQAMYLAGKLPDYATRREDIINDVEHQNPGWNWVDPYKDAKAAEVELNLGITNRHRLCSAKGINFDENFEMLKREKIALGELSDEQPE